MFFLNLFISFQECWPKDSSQSEMLWGTCWRTHWELKRTCWKPIRNLDDNTLRATKINVILLAFPTPTPSPYKRKKLGAFGCMLSHLISNSFFAYFHSYLKLLPKTPTHLPTFLPFSNYLVPTYLLSSSLSQTTSVLPSSLLTIHFSQANKKKAQNTHSPNFF